MKKRLRLIIADDHALFRQGLKSLLLLQCEIEVVGEVERLSELSHMLTTTPCDVLLLDLQMERWAIGDIQRLSRVARVVVLTASERKEDLMAALRMGALAFVQKRWFAQTCSRKRSSRLKESRCPNLTTTLWLLAVGWAVQPWPK